jgi:cytochrome P450
MLVYDDLLSAEALADPHAYFSHLREREPVHWNSRWKGWIITAYDDVVQVLRDRQHFSANRLAAWARDRDPEEVERYRYLLTYTEKRPSFLDPPEHTRIRALVNAHFTPIVVERKRSRIRRIVDELLDEIIDQRQAEIVGAFTYRLPLIVLCEYLGVPADDEERELVRQWSLDLGSFIVTEAGDPRRFDRAQDAAHAFVRFLEPIVRARKAAPRDDLLSAMIQTQREGDGLSDVELLTLTINFLFAGHETTSATIANGILAFSWHRDQWELLRQNPSLIGRAVEEVLRYKGATKALSRFATADVEIGGRTIHAGDKCLVVLASANRDPSRFPDPFRFDITRAPNPHVTFGSGHHTCLGGPLARIELQEVFLALTERMPHLRVPEQALEYHPTLVTHSLKRLYVEW